MILNKIFTIFLVVFQLLFLYATPIPSISIADVILLLFYPFLIISLIIKGRVSIKYNLYTLTPFLVYIVFQFLLMSIFEGAPFINEAFFRTGRFLLYMITIIFIGPQFIDIKLARSALKWVSLISTIFLLIQIFAVNFFNIYIPGTIPGLPLMRTELTEFNQSIINAGRLIRPRSFFQEPAQYASYVSVYLAIGLFSLENKKFKDYFIEIIITIGLIVSNSATGIISAVFVWGLWYLHNMFKKKKNGIVNYDFIIYSGILIPIISIVFILSSYFQIFLNRILGTGTSPGSALMGRFGNYQWAFSIDNLSINELLFGRGMIDIPLFIPAIPKLFYYFGLLGLLLFLFIMSFMYKNSTNNIRVLILLIFILSLGGDAIFGPNCLFYFLFCLNIKNNNCEKVK